APIAPAWTRRPDDRDTPAGSAPARGSRGTLATRRRPHRWRRAAEAESPPHSRPRLPGGAGVSADAAGAAGALHDGAGALEVSQALRHRRRLGDRRPQLRVDLAVGPPRLGADRGEDDLGVVPAP